MTGSGVGDQSSVSTSADSVLLIDVARAVLDRCGGQRWSIKPSEAWCYLSPPDGHSREHGWKLHVSATPLSAPLVLARAGEVLVKAGCAFKFGTDLPRVAQLVNQWYSRGGGGKFITVYPKDDAQFRELAEQLHEATAGLPGPGILSDKRLRPGSLVYYRYGEISGSGQRFFNDDGTFERRMVGPDGTAVEDERNAWFSPPAWATSPFPDEEVETPQTPASVLLGDRYRVLKAIRHANKGGVYRAVDERDGSDVVIKQARAHVSSELDGTDVRDRLRQEARMLQELQPLDVAPACLELMQLEDDLFLVQEQVPGQTMEKWAQGNGGASRLSRAEALETATRLVGLVEKIHQGGYVIRDLKTSNLMMLPDGDLRIIDVEYVTRIDTVCRPIGTPHFMAPELAKKDEASKVATAATDCYSLGATLFHAITGLSPSWLARKSDATRQEIEETLAQIVGSYPALPDFADLILNLTEPDPEQRWTLPQARERLTALAVGDSTLAALTLRRPVLTDERLDTIIDEQVRLLQTSMTPQAEQLWKQTEGDRDDCALWQGAAGGLSALTQAAAHGHGDDTLREALTQAAAWVDQRLFAIPRLLPGLAFGRAGTAWALHDAGRLLENLELQARAIELAEKLPTRWHTADVTHGLSGAGVTHLHLWYTTGKSEQLDQALACADAVLAVAHRDGDDWSWPIPEGIDSALAGLESYGFAHGVAGVGDFLLAAAQAAEQHMPGSGDRFHQAALGAGDTLVRAAQITETGASWPRSTKKDDSDATPDTESRMFWCNGSGGIGSFLIRLWSATREQRFADLAEHAAAAITHNPWPHPAGACCGLAGAGHFLLDMTHHTGQDTYYQQARTLAAVIDAQTAAARDPQHPQTDYSYQTGTAGTLRFHLRLRHHDQHPWTPPHAEIAPLG
ncbi:class IV lanthionine synthetase LanL [Streptomyces sp. NBC_01077]|uniref:class IV lanthionine synthetase LanL n=1 Tax=Streptomyces sp. NBC_01077 TaxID=2903746 RepID=UPI003864E7D1|nr:class IV lanthionine synthetase LanL [Streptomyces sp. NBC_01077]WSV43637.1 class IV lanthionine synthetase LanL [Streptomyces sp. NBC_01077]